MRFPRFWLLLIPALAALALTKTNADEKPTPEELAAIERLNDAQAKWEKADRPGPGNEITEALVDAAVSVNRPDVVENVLAGGKLKALQIPIRPGGKRVTLLEVRHFPGIDVDFADEMLASIKREGGWLARRITKDRIEVWTPNHGWLLDGSGKLVAETNVERHGGTGREWYGAFLPDGRWITTQISENDSTLSFYNTKGERVRTMRCGDLAPKTQNAGADLIGWARSDKDGLGWVVNVGSENGYATVWVAPEGPARVLRGIDRWQLCFPRALGPRGSVWTMEVPNDQGTKTLSRSESGHGKWVGYPGYSLAQAHQIPAGSYVFGFWPGGLGTFVGSETYPENAKSAPKTRKWSYSRIATKDGSVWQRSSPLVDKTWFFDPAGNCTGWLAGHRIGDAADGKSMHFRLMADSRVVVLKPDFTAAAIHRMQWKDGTTADPLTLWDDLRCGLFVRDRKLILAAW